MVNLLAQPALSPPQQKRAFERRAACIDAAREILLVDGVDGLTMHGASEAAGGSKAAIYRYFSDRTDLVDAVVQADRERLESLFERYADAMTMGTELDVLHQAVRAMVDLRVSATGAVPISLNSLGRSRHRDHVSKFAWSIAARVHFASEAGLVNLRLNRYEYIVASVDAVLVRARRSATREETGRLQRMCVDVVAAVLRD
ncbi:TetR/AcrR family transcriptional regulator [Agreia sp. PsM10]|uniref:TetR/AcrR family transcriptional regulator n=1 Tax=Agreia sp. PsM10 TaxID=3030533 RepID=UPI00263BD835|nr:TetR/AcrR family transcriptional regulator [Agreia sp. PsM10]MDN4641453.1 TetR/AcrR family transcriptional regulator [Agreia sp. PsM10]